MLRGSKHLVDPWQWCANHRTLQGRMPLRECSRLLPLLADFGGEAEFGLAFGKLAGRPIVRGSVRAKMQVVCQRCLDSMPLHVDANVSIAFVRGIDEANRLPDTVEPFVVEEDAVDLRVLVEDELLLAIPANPRHELQDCAVELESFSAGHLNEKTASPFAALAALRGKRVKAK